MKEQDLGASELDRRLHASVLKREAWKEKEWQEAKAARDAEVMLGFGGTDMTKEELKKLIDSDRRLYYRTVELNDKLYIQYKGWKTLQNLEGWTGLKALYAECNAFDRIQGLTTCRSLRSLFLQENCIRRISGLEGCPDLYNLNLSSNFIECIEGLSHLKKLNSLIIAKNKIGFRGLEDVVELLELPSLATVDIQDNKIWDPDVLPEIFSRMVDLRCLYLKGNSCCKGIPNYRKSTTVYCKELRYLDDRPVFPDDRRAAEAFNRGGLEEERAERRRIRDEANEKHDRNMRSFQEMIDNSKREKRERDAMRAEDKFTNETDPVESQERRMQRQIDQWKEENADDLKDDAREYAEKCLAAEQQGQGGAGDTAADTTKADEAGEASEAQRSAETHVQGESAPEERTLVYDDIWEDVPTAPAVPEQASPRAAERGAAGELGAALPAAPRQAEVQRPREGVFLPWATGDGVFGMDAVAPAGEAMRRRDAQARQEATPEPSAAANAQEEGRPGWYSKYAEKVQSGTPASAAATTDAATEGKPPELADSAEQGPPPAGASALAPARAGAELDEMD